MAEVAGVHELKVNSDMFVKHHYPTGIMGKKMATLRPMVVPSENTSHGKYGSKM